MQTKTDRRRPGHRVGTAALAALGLALAAPAILLIDGLLALVRAYQSWRAGETAWAWLGAG